MRQCRYDQDRWRPEQTPMHASTLLTAADLANLPDPDLPHELWRGVVRLVTAAGGAHGSVCSRLLAALSRHVYDRDLGELFTEGTGFRLERDPDTLLCPDVAFVARERLSAGSLQGGWLELAPDLAVEVLSPGDRPGKARAKIALYLKLGVRAVWMVDPKTRCIRVYERASRQQAGLAPVVLSASAHLDGGEILPGFSCPVAAAFAGVAAAAGAAGIVRSPRPR
jgi:Uma2 family endonuclease